MGENKCLHAVFTITPNVFKPDPDTEPDDLLDRWVIGSTAGELQVNKWINFII